MKTVLDAITTQSLGGKNENYPRRHHHPISGGKMGLKANVYALWANLGTEILHDTIIVTDSNGGRWWPNEKANQKIQASTTPEVTAIRICSTDPMQGTWAS